MSGRLSEGGGAENARYANRETTLMFPIVITVGCTQSRKRV